MVSVDHPNLVKLFGLQTSETTGGPLKLVYEYVVSGA